VAWRELDVLVWGAHHGCLLVIERAGLTRVLNRAPALAARLYALFRRDDRWSGFAPAMSTTH